MSTSTPQRPVAASTTPPRQRRASRIDADILAALAARPEPGARGFVSRFVSSVAPAGAGVGAKAGAFLITVSLALLAALPIVYLSGSDAATAIEALLGGSWGSGLAIGETFVQAIPLLISGLAVAVAFHTGLFNIGVEGQLVMGGLAAGIVGATVDLPGPLLLLACLAAGVAGGALWALIPALLKAFRGVHEVVTTIMMNYIAFNVSRFLVSPSGPFVSETQPSATEKIPLEARLAVVAPGTRLHAGLVIAILLVIAVAWLLYRTPEGFRLRLVGANPAAASTAGVSLRRTVVTSMLLSGGIAGIAGAVQVLGVFGRYYDAFSPGYGFEAIAVALLGALSPIGIAAAALFFGSLDAGAVQLQAVAGISREMVSVVSGLVVAFVAAQPAVLRLLRHLRERASARRAPARPTSARRASGTDPKDPA
ncbi:ABC transporter permease [Herbiconiux moechotypicola]|uniref:ABC transporter permease n=1 Tax=Herbiconiux moechotypicola TaxID=637393 RepID=A0ABN3DEK6_9MICO|nr:ABC transporter permease [Herbiconiux moechotypicola]MCS5729331.1 ABC transporter permease [Herbiconiux moechotypicola]